MDDGINARDAARNAAQQAVQATEGVTHEAAQDGVAQRQAAEQPSGGEHTVPDRPFSGVEQVTDPESGPEPVLDLQEAPHQEIGPVEQLPPDQVDRVYEDLLRMGVDLGIPPSQIADPDARAAYLNVAEQVTNTVTDARREAMEAVNSKMQIQEFTEKLRDDPKKILLMLGINHPDVFRDTMETFERMQDDEREKDLVMRELSADAQLAAAERARKVGMYGELQQRAQRVTNATRVEAMKAGIPFETAEKWVARDIDDKIKMGQNYDISDVPGSIGGLKQALQGYVPPARPAPVASQQTVAAQQTADTLATEGAGAPTPESTEQPLQGGRGTENMSSVRSAVRQAFRNTLGRE